jgi:NADH:ubiquinone oxidoreductase subunit 2 (subunit N)
MSRSKNQRKKLTRNDKIMAVVGILIIISMVLGSIAALLTSSL